MNDKAVANVSTGMLDQAVEFDKKGFSSVMDGIHTLKIYNPRIGDPIEEDKAWKFKLKVANTWVEEFIDGPIVFNPLSVRYFYSWHIYPILDNGTVANEKITFYTNEYGKYLKKTDTIGLAAKGKSLWFFSKEDFKAMIKARTLNGRDNQFYDRKKDREWKPFDGSLLSEWAVVYGQFVWWTYDWEFFRFFTATRNLWVTFRDWSVCEPDAGTFEYAVSEWLIPLNEVLTYNGKRTVNKVDDSQVDLKLTIEQNEKKNFMPKFEYSWLVVLRWGDNREDKKFIEELQFEHFKSVFWWMGSPNQVLLNWSDATTVISQPALSTWELTKADLEAMPDIPFEDTAKEVFEVDLSTPDF